MVDIKIHASIAELPGAQWNALRQDDYPFMSHEFLLALESTQCVCAETGWQPMHLAIENESGQLTAVMPLYLKSHPWGEYVFDWSWEDAWHHYGLEYYPKLVTSIPFTPSVGPRILFDPSIYTQERITALFTDAVRQLCRQQGFSSWHGLFIKPSTLPDFTSNQLLAREGCQYHWFNRGYRDFDDYLGTFTSRKRKTVRKERRRIEEQGIHLETLEGNAITPQQLTQFYRFYRLTYLKHGQRGYLSESFFQQLLNTMPDQLLLVLAFHEGHPVAGALSLKDSQSLYGRYWGCTEEFDDLHFETCYYRGLDYCIANGLKHFDSGAQGEHKIARGFEPIPTWSVHWIESPLLRPAVEQFVTEEQQEMELQIEELKTRLPFHQQ